MADRGVLMTTSQSELQTEAARLLAQLQDWAQRGGEAATQHGEPGSYAAQHAADGLRHGPDCEWCPVCQFVAVLRGERPELTERVAEAGVAVVTALRGLLDAVVGAAAHPDAGADDSGAPPPRVQHIDLGGTE
jgi:hypothetical protein